MIFTAATEHEQKVKEKASQQLQELASLDWHFQEPSHSPEESQPAAFQATKARVVQKFPDFASGDNIRIRLRKRSSGAYYIRSPRPPKPPPRAARAKSSSASPKFKPEPIVAPPAKRKHANLYIQCENCDHVAEPPLPAELGGDRKRAYFRVEKQRQFDPCAASESGSAQQSADAPKENKAEKKKEEEEGENKGEKKEQDTTEKLEEVRASVRPRCGGLYGCMCTCVVSAGGITNTVV